MKQYKKCLVCKKKFSNLRKDLSTLGVEQFNKRKVCSNECNGELRRRSTNKNSYKCNGNICTMSFYERGIKKETIFDKKFLKKVKKYNWYGVSNRYVHSINKRYSTLLHRLIIGNTKKCVVDHINGDGLDNRLSNLRLVSQRVNCINQSIKKNSKTGRRGVYEHKYKAKNGLIKISYIAHITCNYKVFAKCFPTLQEAINYRIKLEKRFGFDKYMRYN